MLRYTHFSTVKNDSRNWILNLIDSKNLRMTPINYRHESNRTLLVQYFGLSKIKTPNSLMQQNYQIWQYLLTSAIHRNYATCLIREFWSNCFCNPQNQNLYCLGIYRKEKHKQLSQPMVRLVGRWSPQAVNSDFQIQLRFIKNSHFFPSHKYMCWWWTSTHSFQNGLG